MIPLDRSDGCPATDEVVLLDHDGRPVGVADRLSVHTTDTPLHLAFSSYLTDGQGRVLITRRALSKRTWPGVWTNSCCGHPRPGEEMSDAVRRRVREELGLDVAALSPVVPDFRYRATDVSGIVENEICPVLWGTVSSPEVVPDPAEVADHAWVTWDDLRSAVAATPQVFSPWCVLQVPRVDQALGSLGVNEPRDVDPKAFITDVDELTADVLEHLQARWEMLTDGETARVLVEDLPQWLGRLLVGRGKRLRAAMSFWSFVAAGGHLDDGAYRDVVRFAAALETLHMFALVHDDVMDQSPSRRGSPSAHVEAARWHADSGAAGDSDLFGLSMAILLGDLAHMLADHLIIDLPADQQRLWFDLCVELIVGQRADIAGAAGARRDRRHAEHIARLKSGRYSVERPLELGAVAAGARPEILAALQGYGEHLGRVFALRDDQLGIWGDPATTGKPIGDDLAEGKATVVMSLAADRLSGEAAEALQRLGTRDLRPGDVAVVTEALEACGIRDEVEALIGSELARALACLAESTLTPAGVAGLKSTAEAVAWRQS